MAIAEGLEMRKCLCCGSIERKLHSSRKMAQDLLKMPKVLMERLAK